MISKSLDAYTEYNVLEDSCVPRLLVRYYLNHQEQDQNLETVGREGQDTLVSLALSLTSTLWTKVRRDWANESCNDG